MSIRSQSKHIAPMFSLLSVFFICAVLMASIAPSRAFAQSGDDPWSDPINLSRSGFVFNPGLVIDSTGIGHAVWQDDLGNYMYSRFDGEQWSAPIKTNLNQVLRLPAPGESQGAQAARSDNPKPLFLASPGDYIYAFWISEDGRLFISKVVNDNFEKSNFWDGARVIAPSVTAFAVTLDARGELHVVYQSSPEDTTNPVGIYYRRSKSNGSSWGPAVRIYESPYLRTLTENEASLSIVTAETEDVPRIYVAWDNRPRKQVFLSQSGDGGDHWEEPVLVAGPAPDTSLDGPFDIRVGAHGDSVVLVWQNGRPGIACSQISESSHDGGVTWSDQQVLMDNLLGCEQSNNFLAGPVNDPKSGLYFLTETKNQTFLSIWDGRQWSQPQVQPILARFKEPEIYTEVIYGCHRPAMIGERLYVLGCDRGEGGDVWVTSRDLASSTSGLQPPVWSDVLPVNSGSYKVDSVSLVTTDDGLIHSFLSQPQDPAIYYTNWNGESWTRITSVVDLPEGVAGWPAIAAGPGDELFLVVPNNLGQLFFSRTISGASVMSSNWSTPTELELGHTGKIGAVDVARNASGTIYVAYSIPVNQERGVYFVVSKDEGATWSAPLQLFDGTAAGFDFVGAPSLLATADGSLHVVWDVQSVQGDGSPEAVSLYYARSEDGGHIFDPAELILDESVAWRDLVTDSKGNLHLLWQPQGTLTTVWDQVSMDGGHTWQYPNGLAVTGRLVTVTSDPAGELHLLDIDPAALGHWRWEGNGWKPDVSLSIPVSAQLENSAELLAAAVNKQGKMMVFYTEPTSVGNGQERVLLYSTRSIDLPRIQPQTQNAATKTQVAPTTSPNTPAPENTEIAVGTPQSEPTSTPVLTDNDAGGRISPFTIALVPVALLLLGVLGVMIRQVVRTKDR